jgi:hypothetical protein
MNKDSVLLPALILVFYQATPAPYSNPNRRIRGTIITPVLSMVEKLRLPKIFRKDNDFRNVGVGQDYSNSLCENQRHCHDAGNMIKTHEHTDDSKEW